MLLMFFTEHFWNLNKSLLLVVAKQSARGVCKISPIKTMSFQQMWYRKQMFAYVCAQIYFHV